MELLLSSTATIYFTTCPEQGEVIDIMKERLKIYNYNINVIRVSADIIAKFFNSTSSEEDISEYRRIEKFIDLGNNAREGSGDNSILALGAAARIMETRNKDNDGNVMPYKRVAHIINSLKHPDEVRKLREIYSNGFFLVGVYEDKDRRFKYLNNTKGMAQDEANKLIERDMDEFYGHGQHTRDTFHLADFFIHIGNNKDQIRSSIYRIIDLMFGHPFITPTFNEYAMFAAFTAALRSADLSRQVGAVIARDNEIIAYGSNDCPKAGGGLYWPEFDENKSQIIDYEKGRDYKRGWDSNKVEQDKLINNIMERLQLKPEAKEELLKSGICDLTEYGRVVHAEMEAILMCSRNNISTRSATLYCTTFPCHNCAKHIIAAGIKKVIYIEPYPKSKASEFYDDSIVVDRDVGDNSDKIEFLPFIGVGPRKFFDLFSISLGTRYNVIRKDKTGKKSEWNPNNAKLRCQLQPYSYLEWEFQATNNFYNKVGGEYND